MDPFSSAVTVIGSSAKSRVGAKVVDAAWRHSAGALAFTRAWAIGPPQPRIGGEASQAPDVATGVSGMGNYLQTAHSFGSRATNLLLGDDEYAHLLQLAEEHEELLHSSEFSRLSLTYRTATLALGLYSVIRFGDELAKVPSPSFPSRSHELLSLADRLFQTTEGFRHQTRDYDRLFAGLDSRSGDVLQLLNECTIVRSLAHRRFDPSYPRVARPVSADDPAIWSLTRQNGVALTALASLGGDGAPAPDLHYSLRSASVANAMTTPDSDRLNHRFRLYQGQSSLQASQSVFFAKGYSHLLQAACLLIEDWDAPSPSRLDLLRVRNSIAFAHLAYKSGPGIWWHSYANLFIVWGLLRYREKQVGRFQRAVATAVNVYVRTNDEGRAAKLEGIVRRSIGSSLTRADAVGLLT